MPTPPVDPAEIRAVVQSAGVPCGALTPVGAPAKRQVLTDGKMLVRVALATAVMRNSPQEEVAWAQRIAAVVPAQRPLAGPIGWNGSPLTVWEWLEGSQVTTADAWNHGNTLRLLHDRAERPVESCVADDQLDSTRARLQELQDHRIREQLAPMLSVATRVLKAADRGDLVVSHGDAHDRNLLVLDGVVHLLDFDSAGILLWDTPA